MSKALAGFGAGAGVKKATVPSPNQAQAGPASESSSNPGQAPDKSSVPGPANVNKANQNNVDKGSYESQPSLIDESLDLVCSWFGFDSTKLILLGTLSF